MIAKEFKLIRPKIIKHIQTLKTKYDHEEFVIQMLENNVSYAQIADVYNCSKEEVVDFFKRINLKYCTVCKRLHPRQFFDAAGKRTPDGLKSKCRVAMRYPDEVRELINKLEPRKDIVDQPELLLELFSKGVLLKLLKSLVYDKDRFDNFFENIPVWYCAKCGQLRPKTFFYKDERLDFKFEKSCKLHRISNLTQEQLDCINEFNPFKEWYHQEEKVIKLYSLGFRYEQFKEIFGGIEQDFIEFFEIVDIKYCVKCKKLKSRKEFCLVSSKNFIDKLNMFCRSCTSEYNKSPVPYKSWSEKFKGIEETRPHPDNPEILQVKCKYCGEYYTPSRIEVDIRFKAIEGKSISLGIQNYLYCSEECKQKCPVHKAILYPKDQRKYKPVLNRDTNYHKQLKQIKIEENISKFGQLTCEKCLVPTENLILHHIQLIVDDPILAYDKDNTILVCEYCHNLIHEKDGCTRSQTVSCGKEIRKKEKQQN